MARHSGKNMKQQIKAWNTWNIIIFGFFIACVVGIFTNFKVAKSKPEFIPTSEEKLDEEILRILRAIPNKTASIPTQNCHFASSEGRSYQEDRVTCDLNLKIPLFGRDGLEEMRFGAVAVFDGHIGSAASEMASNLFVICVVLPLTNRVMQNLRSKITLSLGTFCLFPSLLSLDEHPLALCSFVTYFSNSGVRSVDFSDSCTYAEIRTRIPDTISRDYNFEPAGSTPLSFTVKQVKPCVSEVDAIWGLLMSDLHVGWASMMEIPVNPTQGGNGLASNVDSVDSSHVGVVCVGFMLVGISGIGVLMSFLRRASLRMPRNLLCKGRLECPKRFNLTP